MYSGINKTFLEEKTLVEKGQTGVAGLSPALIKFVGIAEILGVIGLVLPALINFWTFLVPVSAVCLGLIMIPAALIHYRRNEMKNVVLNLAILIVCFFISMHQLG